MNDPALPADALAYAARAHLGQFRKNDLREPYLHHPLRVALRLSRHGLDDPVLLRAALLHDVLEDTATPAVDLEETFGMDVTRIVRELTDTKELLQSLRKQYQVERAPCLSLKARLIRLSDKIDNLSTLDTHPPRGWSAHRRREYLAWARRVVRGIRGTHAGLEHEFDTVCARVHTALYPPA